MCEVLGGGIVCGTSHTTPPTPEKGVQEGWSRYSGPVLFFTVSLGPFRKTQGSPVSISTQPPASWSLRPAEAV